MTSQKPPALARHPQSPRVAQISSFDSSTPHSEQDSVHVITSYAQTTHTHTTADRQLTSSPLILPFSLCCFAILSLTEVEKSLPSLPWLTVLLLADGLLLLLLLSAGACMISLLFATQHHSLLNHLHPPHIPIITHTC